MAKINLSLRKYFWYENGLGKTVCIKNNNNFEENCVFFKTIFRSYFTYDKHLCSKQILFNTISSKINDVFLLFLFSKEQEEKHWTRKKEEENYALIFLDIENSWIL